MEWGSLLSAALGAVLALSGSLVTEGRRDRKERERGLDQECQRNCVEFSLAMYAALNALREVARAQSASRYLDAGQAVTDAGAYVARERLLITGSANLTVAGERAFLRLIEIRNVVRTGVELKSREYHRAYHAYAEAIWAFRMAVRADLGRTVIEPQDVELPDWSDAAHCTFCNSVEKGVEGEPATESAAESSVA